MYADAAESEKTGKIPADGSREDPAQGFLIFSEFADAGDLYFGAPARKSLKPLDFSREGTVVFEKLMFPGVDLSGAVPLFGQFLFFYRTKQNVRTAI